MKAIIITLSLLIVNLSWAQVNVIVSGNIFNTPTNKLELLHFDGKNLQKLAETQMNDDGTFKFETEVPVEDYYILKIGETNVNLVLKNKSEIQIYGDGAKLDEFLNIVNSVASSNMHKFYGEVKKWSDLIDQANKEVKNDPSKSIEVNTRMEVESKKFKGLQNTFINQNANSPALYAALSTLDFNTDFASYEKVMNQLMFCFKQSPTVAKAFKRFEAVLAQKNASNQLAPGKLAPDFEETKTDGSKMKLSDLRGSVVLIDFWASWCGPCRRENPAVVQLYEQYKDQGFTVISVSLDKDKAKWLAAIEKDNLSWPNHVSDLGSWNSKVARQYGVSSIPFTVLLDAEGKVIKTKLRSHDLAVELAKLFGK